MDLILWVSSAALILGFVSGAIKPSWVKEAMAEAKLDPWLKQKNLPFDKNLAAIGVLEPEFRSVIDQEKYDDWYMDMLSKADVIDCEKIYELGHDRPVMIIPRERVKAGWHPCPPTKKELHWRNMLAES